MELLQTKIVQDLFELLYNTITFKWLRTPTCKHWERALQRHWQKCHCSWIC